MTAPPWFRMYSRLITDPEIEFLSFEDQRHFIWLLCLKNEGYLDQAYKGDKLDRMVGRKLGLTGDALVGAKLRLLESELIDDQWQPRNWDRLQMPSDCSTPRVKEFRRRQREARDAEKAEAEEKASANGETEVKRFDETGGETERNGAEKRREDLDKKTAATREREAAKAVDNSAEAVETGEAAEHVIGRHGAHVLPPPPNWVDRAELTVDDTVVAKRVGEYADVICANGFDADGLFSPRPFSIMTDWARGGLTTIDLHNALVKAITRNREPITHPVQYLATRIAPGSPVKRPTKRAPNPAADTVARMRDVEPAPPGASTAALAAAGVGARGES